MARRWWLPLGALLALIVAGLLAEQIRPLGADVSTTTPEVATTAPPRPIVFPRDRPPRPSRERPERPEPAPESPADPRSPRPLDRFERAAALSGGPMVVAEVNAIRHSALAEKLLRCHAEEVEQLRAELREGAGVDLLDDVDRVMFSEAGAVASGYFESLRLPEHFAARVYGDAAQIFESPEGGSVLARAGDDLLMVFDDAADAEAAIDRLDGRAPSELPAPLLDGGGELYGPLGRAALEGLLGDGPMAPLLDQLDEATVRVAVDDRVALSLDLSSASPEAAKELEGMIRAGLGGLRLEAAAKGEEELKRLLRETRLAIGEDGALALDLAVPGALVLEWMDCGRETEAAEAAGPSSPPPPSRAPRPSDAP